MTINGINFLILAFATFRLSSLFAQEDGPLELFSAIRGWAAKNLPPFYEGLKCVYCNSVWFGVLLAIFYLAFGEIFVWFCLPLALSTVAVIIGNLEK